jgi:hypothetical protein
MTAVLAALLVFSAPGRPADAQGGSVPAGLRSHLMFGLAAHPTDGQAGPTFDNVTWMTSSGTPWDACYQYLAGGANTGNGWANWNTGGYFATKYLEEADNAGYIPVFTYYQLLQSNPHTGSDEGAQDFNNLNNNSTMAAYYGDFKLLMQKCGAFGKPAIVHVEPDLWAYLQNARAGGTDDAANIPAAVASSGFPEAAGLPNTAAGFARCLVTLRDTYARNVLLAHHASGWATGVDLGSDTRTSIDVAAHARRVANFLNSLGPGWDLYFYDPLDRDAGFYEFVYGDGGARWWNESDTPTTCPNFVRIRQWLAYLSQYQNKRCLLWQVPIGNYYYTTCNNTDGHYEDNRAQYFLEGYPANPHLKQWADAGVIGILFGRGAGGPTTYSDDKRDGVSNPARFVNSGTRKSPTNLGSTASFSDDDGGYLRLRVRAYYTAGAVSLPGGTAPPTPAPPPAPSPDFALSLAPSQMVIARGKSGTFTLTLSRQGGFAAPVSLSSSTSPSLRGSQTLGSTSLTTATTTSLRVSVSGRATRGTYTLTVNGVGGGLTHTATTTVVVQ